MLRWRRIAPIVSDANDLSGQQLVSEIGRVQKRRLFNLSRNFNAEGVRQIDLVLLFLNNDSTQRFA